MGLIKVNLSLRKGQRPHTDSVNNSLPVSGDDIKLGDIDAVCVPVVELTREL
jgi:hypothetical protein